MRFRNSPKVTKLLSSRLRSQAIDAPCIARVQCGRQTLAASSKLESESRLLMSSVIQETLLSITPHLLKLRCEVSGFVSPSNTKAFLIPLSTK